MAKKKHLIESFDLDPETASETYKNSIEQQVRLAVVNLNCQIVLFSHLLAIALLSHGVSTTIVAALVF
jgi:hypothetical protein